jgi:hypothetical protein
VDFPKISLSGLTALFKRHARSPQYEQGRWPPLPPGTTDELRARIAQGLVRPAPAPKMPQMGIEDFEPRWRG